MEKNQSHLFLCQVCGFSDASAPMPWGDDGQSPTHDICPCCGVEFGHEDCTMVGIVKYRENWLANGGNWHDKSKQPHDWNLERQLALIAKNKFGTCDE